MTLEEIKQLIQAVIESGIAELEVERADTRVFIRRIQKGRVTHEVSVAAGGSTVHTPAVMSSAAAQAEQSAPAADSSLVLVKAPIVGTFYESPSPNAPAFVKVGDTVQPGQVLCIIESMKLMNEIECEVAGTVASRLVENASAVEYGEALFAIKPL